jgi:2-oxoglutarate ferredoxin oxidoreductase subunit alpha
LRELIDGSTAIVRGALDAGCTFFAGYPITPASSILMQMLRDLPAGGGIGIQAEDEIAAIGMCVGATLAGGRAMTATSGPGISLMSETIGLAIMGEVPLVIVDVQRLGPATGGATTVAQGDVQFVRWGTSGGFPIIALAPASVADCYEQTRRAFDLAERFRCPVFLLADKELALTTGTVEGRPGLLPPVRPREIATTAGAESPHRYEPAEAVAPMAHVGSGVPVRFTGSTHDERGFLTKDPATVGRLNEHLRAKIDAHADEISDEEFDLDPGASTLLVSYGVTAGAVRDAVRSLRRDQIRVSALTLRTLWPVPETAIRAAAATHDRVVVAELNHGQYLREVQRVVAGGVQVIGLQRTDGELITPRQVEELVR